MAARDKFFNAVGLAMRAGRCVSGEFAVEKLLKEGRALLLILDRDASKNAMKQYKDASAHFNVPLILMDGAGDAIGKPERKILALTDKNFVKLVLNAAAAVDGEGTTGVETHGE